MFCRGCPGVRRTGVAACPGCTRQVAVRLGGSAAGACAGTAAWAVAGMALR